MRLYLSSSPLVRLSTLGLVFLMFGCRGYNYEVAYRVFPESPSAPQLSDRELESAVAAVRAVSDRFSLIEIYSPNDPDPVGSYFGYEVLVMASTKTGTRYKGRKVQVSVSASVADDRSGLRFSVLDLRGESPAPPAREIEQQLGRELERAYPSYRLEREEGKFKRDWFTP